MFEEALFRLQYDKTFREILIDTFQACSHHGSFVWEVVPVTKNTLSKTRFSFVLISNVNELLDNQLESHIEGSQEQGSSSQTVYKDERQSTFVAATTKQWTSFSHFMQNDQTNNLHSYWKEIAKQTLEEIDSNSKAKFWLSSSKVKESHWTYVCISRSCEGIKYHPYKV